MVAALIIVAVIVFLLLLFLVSAIKIAREYERGIVFRLGRLLPEPKGPGLFILIPVVDRMVRVDLRTITLNIPPQEVIRSPSPRAIAVKHRGQRRTCPSAQELSTPRPDRKTTRVPSDRFASAPCRRMAERRHGGPGRRSLRSDFTDFLTCARRCRH